MAKVTQSKDLQHGMSERSIADALTVCCRVPVSDSTVEADAFNWLPVVRSRSSGASRPESTRDRENLAFLQDCQGRVIAGALREVVHTDAEVLSALGVNRGDQERRVVMLLVQAAIEDHESEDLGSSPKNIVRDLVLKTFRDGIGSAASGVVQVPAGVAPNDLEFPSARFLLCATLCPDMERATAMWRRIERGTSWSAAASANRLELPRAVCGQLWVSDGTPYDPPRTHAEDFLNRILGEALRKPYEGKDQWELFLYRGHVTYGSSGVSTSTMRRIQDSLAPTFASAIKNKGATLTSEDFHIEFRLKSEHERSDLGGVFGGAKILTLDPWLNQYDLPSEEDAVVKVIDGQSRAEQINESARALIDTFSADYQLRKKALIGLYSGVLTEIAKGLESALNAHCSTAPQATYDEKRSLAKWINSELRQFGLALKCPKTGQPAYLVAHPGGRPGIGRFHLEVAQASGPPQRTLTATVLPELALIPELTPPKAGTGKAPTRVR